MTKTLMECLNCKHTEKHIAPLPEQCPKCQFYCYYKPEEMDDQSYFENLQDCLNHERGAAA